MTDIRTLWAKPRLIRALNSAEAEAEFWRAKYDALTCYALSEDATAPEVREAAQRMLDALPVDRRAIAHRSELVAALDAPPDRVLAVAGRCGKGGCGRPLDEQGRCVRHEWKQRRAERAAS